VYAFYEDTMDLCKDVGSIGFTAKTL